MGNDITETLFKIIQHYFELILQFWSLKIYRDMIDIAGNFAPISRHGKPWRCPPLQRNIV